MPTTAETVIVAALRNGNLRRAVELILATHQEELFAYCLRLVGASQASDVYQRIITLALENVQSLESAASVRAWLFRIARAMVLQFHRASPTTFPQALCDGYVPVRGPDQPDEVPPSGMEPQPTRCLEPAVLEVLQLTLWHGMLLFEVAQVVDRSENEVRRLASQGLSRLSLEGDRSVAPS